MHHSQNKNDRLVLVHMSPHEVNALSKIQGGHHQDKNGVFHLSQAWHQMKNLNGHHHLASGGFAGPNEMPPHLAQMADNGIHGDTQLVAMPYEMSNFLNQSIGGISRNPHDGIPQYYLGQGVINKVQDWWTNRTDPGRLREGVEGPQLPEISRLEKMKNFFGTGNQNSLESRQKGLTGNHRLENPLEAAAPEPEDNSFRSRWKKRGAQEGSRQGRILGAKTGQALGMGLGERLASNATNKLPMGLGAVAYVPAALGAARYFGKKGQEYGGDLGDAALSAAYGKAGEITGTAADTLYPLVGPGSAPYEATKAAYHGVDQGAQSATGALDRAIQGAGASDETPYAEEYKGFKWKQNPYTQNPSYDDEGHLFYDTVGPQEDSEHQNPTFGDDGTVFYDALGED